MYRTERLGIASTLLALLSFAASAFANDWPSRHITLVVPFGPGGAPDIIARHVAQELGDKLGQRVIVENRLGNSGNIGAMAVAKAKPDGYTMLLGTPNPVALNKMILGARQGFDPDKDLRPISVLGKSASVLVTASKNPQTLSISALVKMAKAKPKGLTVGVPGMGTSSHVAMEYFMQRTSTSFTVVPYRGSPAIADILSGELTVAITPTIAYVAMIEEGSLRPLGVTSRTRSRQIPSALTFEEAGLSGFEATTWYVLMAPSETPDAVVNKVNGLVSAYLGSEAGKKMLARFDVEAEVGTPEDAKAFIKSEAGKWKPIIEAAKIKL